MLGKEEAVSFLELAAWLGSECVLAASSGHWRDDVIELCDHYDFRLLGPESLLESAADR